MKTSLRVLPLFTFTALVVATFAGAPSFANCPPGKVEVPCDTKDKKQRSQGYEQDIEENAQKKHQQATNKDTRKILDTTGKTGAADAGSNGYIPPAPSYDQGSPNGYNAAEQPPPLVVKDGNGNYVLNGANPQAGNVAAVLNGAGQWAAENPQQLQSGLSTLQNIVSGDGSAIGQWAADYLNAHPAALNSLVGGLMSGNGLSGLNLGGLNLSSLMNSVLGGGGAMQLASFLPQMGSLVQAFMGGSSNSMGSLLPSVAGVATTFLSPGTARTNSRGLMGYSQPAYVTPALTNNYPQIVDATRSVYFLPSAATSTPQQQAAIQSIRSASATQASIDAYALAQTIRQTQAQTPGILGLTNRNALGSGTIRSDVQANTVAAIALHRQQLDASAVLSMLIEQRTAEHLATRTSLSR